MDFMPYNNNHIYNSGFAVQHYSDSPQFYPPYAQQHPVFTAPRRSNSMTDLNQMARMSHMEKNDTKPRLSKSEVEILERQFQEQHKPSSNTKRQLADRMRVDIARINNWFQNRRAKAKQEKKLVEFGLREAGNLAYSEPSSPEHFNGAGFFDDHFQAAENPVVAFPSGNEPPAPLASYHPRYENPAVASINSLHRTLMVAEAARGELESQFQDQQAHEEFSNPMPFDAFPSADRAQFPATSPQTTTGFQFNDNVDSTERFVEPLLTQPIMLQEPQAPQGFGCFVTMAESGHAMVEASMPTFPSQLIGIPGDQDLTPRPFPAQDFNEVEVRNETQPMPAAMESSFKAPPPPADIAGRRSKPRPAALGTSALRDKTSTGPKTASNTEVVKRMHGSPSMRRVASANGLNVFAGRITKSSQLPQRSPLKRNFSAGPNSFAEQNAHIIKQMPLRNRTWLNRPRGPPTPRSPREILLIQDSMSPEGNLQSNDSTREDDPNQQDNTTPSSSQYESDGSYMFDRAMIGSYTAHGLMTDMVSPPETPANPHGGIHWGYDVTDEVLLTPGFAEGFMQMPQPQYVSPLTASQPATPAFGPFHGFPQANHSPIFDMALSSDQGVGEYFFGDSLPPYPMVSSSKSPTEQPREKTYTFNNATQKDFESS